MGLDAWLYKVDARAKLSEFKVDYAFRTEEIVYWRKNWDINNLVCKIFVAKGGKEEEFNCSTTFLTEEDLLAIKKICEPYEREYIDIAIGALQDGKLVYYTCWW